jgi:predicted nucleic acid-binding protein
VSTSKEIVVKDACIMFDLIDLDLIAPFFQLNLLVLTTPQVINEITEQEQLKIVLKYVDSKSLIIDPWGQVDDINLILYENSGLSFADSSVLELAIRKNAVLLSSDGSLRKISMKRNLTVRGVLWIIEELCEREMISKTETLHKLNLYPQINPRTPKNEIEKLISKLSKTE